MTAISAGTKWAKRHGRSEGRRRGHCMGHLCHLQSQRMEELTHAIIKQIYLRTHTGRRLSARRQLGAEGLYLQLKNHLETFIFKTAAIQSFICKTCHFPPHKEYSHCFLKAIVQDSLIKVKIKH
ncbi:hypothetical protein AOLI_G00296190 [Acnodon oligacanthus]